MEIHGWNIMPRHPSGQDPRDVRLAH